VCLQDVNSPPDVATPTVIFHDAVASVQQIPTQVSSAPAPRQVSVRPLSGENPRLEAAPLDARALEMRCEAICALLRKQRVPFELQREAGEGESSGAAVIVVLGCLRIPAPYTDDLCQCENETVLGRFRQLLAEIPGG
jgi:hypothetical protein